MVSIAKRRAILAWLGLSLGAVTFSKTSVTRIPPRVLQALKNLRTLGDGLKFKFECEFN